MVISEDNLMVRQMNFEVVSRREVPKTLQLVPTIRLKKRVLVVDDEPVIADTLATILRKAGYLATAAYLGTEALNFARQHPPDLLITDLAMPGMDGIDLATRIKGLIPECHILLFSGHAYRDEYLQDPRYVLHHFSLLNKPIHPEDLLDRISRLSNMGPHAANDDCQ